MKKIILLFLCWANLLVAYCQDELIQKTRLEVDSILRLLDTEKDENRRFELILNAYSTYVETYPVLVLETGQKLFKIGQKNKDIIAQVSSLSFYGQGYRLSGSYIKGLEYHHKAIALAQQSGNKSLLALAQNQMAHIYKDREE